MLQAYQQQGITMRLKLKEVRVPCHPDPHPPFQIYFCSNSFLNQPHQDPTPQAQFLKRHNNKSIFQK